MFGRTSDGYSWRGTQGYQFMASLDSVMVVVTQDNGNGCNGGYNVFSVSGRYLLAPPLRTPWNQLQLMVERACPSAVQIGRRNCR